MRKFVALAACVAALAACGGGGGGKPSPTPSSPPVTPPAPTPSATVKVTIGSPVLPTEAAVGDDYPGALHGSWSGQNLNGATVYLQLSDSANTFDPVTITAPADGRYAFNLWMRAGVGVGDRSGTLTVRACQDNACAQPYAGAQATQAYGLKVAAVPDWETFGGNASHTGYVPIRIDPARLRAAWEFTPPGKGANLVTQGSRALLVTRPYVHADQTTKADVIALDGANGATLWTQPMPYYLGAAHARGGMLYAASGDGTTVGMKAAHLVSIRVDTGALNYAMPLGTASIVANGVTLADDGAYLIGGRWGDKMMAFTSATGAARWTSDIKCGESQAPVIVAESIYCHTQFELRQVQRSNGVQTGYWADAPFTDPYTPNGIYGGGIVVGGRGNLLTLNGDIYPRKLSSHDIATRKIVWTAARSYTGLPIVANGVVYAISQAGGTLDALDESNGQLLWSAAFSGAPAGVNINFLNSLLVTRNLLFFNSTLGMHVLDLQSKKVVANYTLGGHLAISADRKLYVMQTNPSGVPDRLGVIALR